MRRNSVPRLRNLVSNMPSVLMSNFQDRFAYEVSLGILRNSVLWVLVKTRFNVHLLETCKSEVAASPDTNETNQLFQK